MLSRIVVFDVETPNSKNDRICAIGIAVIEEGRISWSNSYLINPECSFDARNIEIHGVTPEKTAEAPTFDVVWNEIGVLFRNNLVVAHNATFDLCVLKKTLAAYGIEESLLYYTCTLKISRDCMPDISNHRLPTLCEEFGIELDHHDAHSDCLACANVLCGMVEEFGVNIDDYIASYSLKESPHGVASYKRESASTHALHELSSLIADISQDGLLTESEVDALQLWLDENSSLRGNYPYDKIYQKIDAILLDGIVDKSEKDELLVLFQSVSDPLNNRSCGCVCTDIVGKTICLSGEFCRGEKSEIARMCEARGAEIVKSVTKKTNIVLVGECGSSAWSAGNYGSKIKKALEMQEKGIDILIVKENDFFGE